MIVLSLLTTEPAWAAHGKAGTWEVSSRVEGFATAALLQIVRVVPRWDAALQARGVRFGDGGRMTMRYCLTAEQVNANQPLLAHTESCHTANLKIQREHLSANVICAGRWDAQGQIDVVFDGPGRYHGRQTITARLGAFTVTRAMTVEARWIAPDCKTVP